MKPSTKPMRKWNMGSGLAGRIAKARKGGIAKGKGKWAALDYQNWPEAAVALAGQRRVEPPRVFGKRLVGREAPVVQPGRPRGRPRRRPSGPLWRRRPGRPRCREIVRTAATRSPSRRPPCTPSSRAAGSRSPRPRPPARGLRSESTRSWPWRARNVGRRTGPHTAGPRRPAGRSARRRPGRRPSADLRVPAWVPLAPPVLFLVRPPRSARPARPGPSGAASRRRRRGPGGRRRTRPPCG